MSIKVEGLQSRVHSKPMYNVRNDLLIALALYVLSYTYPPPITTAVIAKRRGHLRVRGAGTEDEVVYCRKGGYRTEGNGILGGITDEAEVHRKE